LQILKVSKKVIVVDMGDDKHFVLRRFKERLDKNVGSDVNKTKLLRPVKDQD